MRAKNTYSRKKKVKSRPVNINVNINYNFFTNVTKVYQTKPASSQSDSSDLFDQIVKGPVYNAAICNTSTFSDNSKLYFSKRQDTVTFYPSDSEPHDSIERRLFKSSTTDSKECSQLSTPPEYCFRKNKLIKKCDPYKVNKKVKRYVEINLKNGIVKKREKGQKNNLNQSKPCTSSTPSKSLDKSTFSDIYISPIPLIENTPRSSKFFATGEDKIVAKQTSQLGMTALIEGLGNLGIQTPHHNKLTTLEKCSEKNPEQFEHSNQSEHENPNSKCDDLEGDDCEKISTALDNNSCKTFGNVETITKLNLKNHDSCGNILNNSRVLSPQRKSFEDGKRGTEPEQLVYQSPSPVFTCGNNRVSQEVSGSSPISSPQPLRNQENLLSSKNQFPSNLISSGVSENQSRNESAVEADFRTNSLTLGRGINCLDISTLGNKSGIVGAETSTIYHDNSDCLGLSPAVKSKSNQHLLQAFDGFIKTEGKDVKSQESRKDSEQTSLLDSYCQKTPVKLKNQLVGERKRSQRYTNNSERTHFNDSGCNKSPIKECNPEIKEQTRMSHRSIKGVEDSCVNDLHCKKLSAVKLKPHDTKAFGDLSNVRMDTSYCKMMCEIDKKTLPPYKENKKPDCSSTEDNTSNLQLLDDTFHKLSLEAGKKWRRSFLRQKQQEVKFSRRVTMSANTLVRLIKEANISNMSSIAGMSFDRTTRYTFDSAVENREYLGDISSIPGSPGVNFTLGDFSKVYTRRRRNYMNEIPEENSDQYRDNCSETDLFEEEPELEDAKNKTGECMSNNDTTADRTDIYETPPLLKINSEALSAITERKRSRYHYSRSLGESTLFFDENYQSEAKEELNSSDEENHSFTSCYNELGLNGDVENLDEEQIQIMGKVGFLLRCGQEGPMSFSEAFPEGVLENGKKIGEGVFGEVFMLERPGDSVSVIKIIPIEGSGLVNGEPQKRFEEVLFELIITEELSMLRQNTLNCTAGFCELKNKFFLEGQYPPQLLQLWHEFHNRKGSDNECPDMFRPDQLYLALELAHAGEPLDAFKFKSPQEALAVFLQTTFSLAIAETALDFEHRDLHIGNVLVKKTSQEHIPYQLKGGRFECPTFGLVVAIIDYSLSRMSFKGDVLFFDLEKDPELFTADGDDYQFDIYRHMRQEVNNNWREHHPRTNVWWLHYLIVKLINSKYRQKKSTKLYKEYMEKLVGIEVFLLDFNSVTEMAEYFCSTFTKTVPLIRKS